MLFLKNYLEKIGEDSVICNSVLIFGPERISVGKNVSINEKAIIQARKPARVTIEDNVTISYGAMILTAGLDITSNEFQKEHIAKSIIIEKDSWIGAKSIILPGITIGAGSVVAAGAVVTKDVPQGVLVGGVPAKIIKSLNKLDRR